MNMVIAIAAGGACGALARHFAANYLTLWLGRKFPDAGFLGTGFPWGIFLVNISGSFLMGLSVILLMQSFGGRLIPLPYYAELRAFITVGCLGAFTTFSTFSMETVLLFERGAYASAFFYVAGSVLLSLFGFFLGMKLAGIFAG